MIGGGLRKKNTAVFSSFDEGINTARDCYSRGDFIKSFDIYEQLLRFPEADKFSVLEEIYDRFKMLPFSDRYNIYQSRLFDFNIKDGDKVLDIGSGNVPFPLATHLADITIEDNAYGRAGVPFKYLENKPVYEINIEDMPFEDKEFDFVYCSHVLEHVENPERACRELMRVGKRGYIEVPKYHKDLIFNTARISNHLWKIELEDNTLTFKPYDEKELDGLEVDIFREMSLNPLSHREKAFFSLIHLKADLFNTMFLWEKDFKVQVSNKRILGNINKNIRLNFVIIVLNGMPFIELLVESIYKFAHKIVIVEGAVENCKFAAGENGSSIDGTVEYIKEFDDFDNKITLVQGLWEEKLQMQNKALEFIDSGYVWLVDSDELYKDEDILKVIDLLSSDNSITQMNFISHYNFWKGLDYYFTSPEFFKPIHHYRRIFRYKEGCYFTSHRPPTLFYPEDNTTSDKINVIDGFQTFSMGINLYHYSYVLPAQVEQKIKLYDKYGWGNDWNLNLIEWYYNFFLGWTPENREELEKKYPAWTGSKDSYIVKFHGSHPEPVLKLFSKLENDSEEIINEYTQNWIGDFDERGLNIPDQYAVSEVIGDITYQKKVLKAWSFIQTDSPIEKRKKWISYNIQNHIPFWNIHVALSYTSSKLKPQNYLEVGVRIGGSMVQVMYAHLPDSITAVDIWSGEYASLPNTIEFTQKQLENFLKLIDKESKIEYIHGNSHEVLKKLINENKKYTLITIDGDHTLEGAEEDLEDAVKLLEAAGVIIFDDITHPAHKYLLDLSTKFAKKHSLSLIINTHQDNGCAIFLKGIDIWEFLKAPVEEEKEKLKIAEEFSKGEDLTEISNESHFSRAITDVMLEFKPLKLIETGTYLGKGTTKIIASALRKLKNKATFYSIEVNPKNHQKAAENISASGLTEFVNLLNGLSVPKSLLPDKSRIFEETVASVEFKDVFIDHPENERVEKYFDETNFPGLPEDLLGQCLAEFEYKPDFVLLDSGGHMGYIEFNYLISNIQSECIIALDDVYHIKHHKSFLFMKQDQRFEVIVESKEKFGFCIAKFTPIKNEDGAKSDYKKERINCLSCGSKLSFPVRGNDIVQCLSCSFVYLKERLTTSEMERYYRNVYAVNDPFAASPVRVPKSIDEIESKKEYKGALREELFNEAVKYYNKDIKNKKFIDIGCGWGGLLYTANKNGMKVTGFEFTQPNVEFARNVLGFDIRQQQFDSSDIPVNSIDIITMSHVLEHVPEPVSFVKKIYDSLKNGGLFYCVVPNFNSLCSSIEKEEWLWLEREWHYSQFTPNVLKNIFEEAGFTIEKLETVSGDYGSEAPMAALKKTNPKLINTNDLKLALAEINQFGRGEEIRIIAQKKPGKKQTHGKKNLLWIRTDSIGDAIMSLNMLEKFAQNLPEYSVTVVCQEHIKEMYASAPFVDNILTFDRKRVIEDKKYQKDVAEKIKETNADLLINSVFSRDLVSDFFTKESAAQVKLGFDSDLSNMTELEMKISKNLYDYLVSVPSKYNEMEKNATFLSNFSIEVDDYKAKMFLDEKDILFAENFFNENNLIPEKTVAFFAGAQYNIRYYYDYGKAMESSLKTDDYTVVALGGKNDEYINGLNLQDFTGKIINLTGKTSFKESAAILGKCKLAIGSETSLAHAACALNVPNVIILGGGHFGRFMPYSELTTIVSLPIECFNCNWGCKYPEVYCIKMIDSKTLSEAIKDRLSLDSNKSRAFFQKRYTLDWLGEQPQFVEPKSVNSNNSDVVFIDAETREFMELKLELLRKDSGLKQSNEYMIQQYKGLIESNSKDFEKYKSIENKAIKNNDIITLLNDAKKLDNYPLMLLRGLYEYENNNLASAETILKELLKYSPNNYRAILFLAEISFNRKDYINSFRLFNYLVDTGISLGKKELKMLNTSRVVNGTRIMNQITSAKYYELPPETIKKEIEIANVTSSKISIIIPSKSRSTQLIETLESIINAAFNIDYEVLLYLNQDFRFSREEMTKYHITRIYYDNEIFPDGGFSWTKLMNHGFKNASGEWLMYGSDDIVFHPFAFNYAFANPIAEDIGGINFLHRNTVEDYGGFYKKYGFDTYGMKPYINFGLIRKSAFLETDGFFEEILFYAGDVDICRQIVNKGYKIIPSYYSLVEHNNTMDKIRSEKSDKIFIQDTNTFICKWADEVSTLADYKIIKERIVVDDIYPFKKKIYSYSMEYSILPEKLIEIDKDYSEIEIIEKNKKRDKSKIRVSAIVSVYNSGKFIKGCLEDLTSQTLFKKGLLEIVVVNCGTDKNDEREITKFKSKYPNIIYIKLEDRVGIYKAWNIGIKAASGEFVTNANTDDRHKIDALEIMLSVFDIENSVDVVYADCYKTEKPNDTFLSNSPKQVISWADYDKDLILFGCFIGPQPVWRKSLHDKFGFFNESLEVIGDYEFWLRISRQAKFYHLKETLGLYYYSSSSAEHRNRELTNRENMYIQNMYMSKYINSRKEVNSVYEKVRKMTGNDKENNYFKLVSNFLDKREHAISLENEFIGEIQKGFKNQKYDSGKLVSVFKQLIALKNLTVNEERILVFFELYNVLGYKQNNDKSKVDRVLKKVYRMYPLQFVAEYLGYDTSYFTKKTELTTEQLFVEVNQLIENKNYKAGIEKILSYLSSAEDVIMANSNQDLELLYNLLGNLCLLEGNYEKAHQSFEEELKLNPTSSRACAGLSETFLAAGLMNEAKTMLEWALKHKPDDEKLFSRLVELNQEIGLDRFDFSLYEEDNTMQKIQDSEDYINSDNLIEAEKILLEILSNSPADIDALNNLSAVYILSKNFKEAVAKLERVFAIDPSNEIAAENLQHLNSILEQNN